MTKTIQNIVPSLPPVLVTVKVFMLHFFMARIICHAQKICPLSSRPLDLYTTATELHEGICGLWTFSDVGFKNINYFFSSVLFVGWIRIIWLKITIFFIGLTTVSPSSPPPSSPSPKSNDAIQDDDPHCQSVSDNDAQIHSMQDEDSHCNPLHDDDSRCHPLQNDDDPRCSSPVVDDASDQHLSPPSSSGNVCFCHCFSS